MLKLKNLEIQPGDETGHACVIIPGDFTFTGEEEVVEVDALDVALAAAYLLRIAEEAGE